MQGDIALWNLSSLDGESNHTYVKKFGYNGLSYTDWGKAEVIFTVDHQQAEADSLLDIYIRGYYAETEWRAHYYNPYAAKSLSNESYLPWFNMYSTLTKPIATTFGDYFWLNMQLLGIPAHVYNSQWSTPPHVPDRYSYQQLRVKIFLGNQFLMTTLMFTNSPNYTPNGRNVFSYGNFNSQIPIESLPWVSYHTQQPTAYVPASITAINFEQNRVLAALGSYSETGGGIQRGNVPFTSFSLNKVGIIRAI